MPRDFQNLEWLNRHAYCKKNIRRKFLLPLSCFDAVFPPAQSACNFDTSADRNVGKSRLCDRSRSSAIIWKQLSLQSSAISAICDPRLSAIVCDHMETSLKLTSQSNPIKWSSYSRLITMLFFFQKIIHINCKDRSVTDLTAGEI